MIDPNEVIDDELVDAVVYGDLDYWKESHKRPPEQLEFVIEEEE